MWLIVAFLPPPDTIVVAKSSEIKQIVVILLSRFGLRLIVVYFSTAEFFRICESCSRPFLSRGTSRDEFRRITKIVPTSDPDRRRQITVRVVSNKTRTQEIRRINIVENRDVTRTESHVKKFDRIFNRIQVPTYIATRLKYRKIPTQFPVHIFTVVLFLHTSKKLSENHHFWTNLRAFFTVLSLTYMYYTTTRTTSRKIHVWD